MSDHSFSVKDAEMFGIEKAIILKNLRFWLDKNAANNRHLHDGYYWTYNSAKAFSRLFPYWSSSKIQRILKDMEDDGLIITGNYNETAYDRTKWYTLPEYLEGGRKCEDGVIKSAESIPQNCGMENSDLRNRKHKVDQPIPDVKPDSNPDVKPDSKQTASASSCDELVLFPVQPSSVDLVDESDPVESVFLHWQNIHNHSRAKLDGKRRKKIKDSLSAGYSVDDLKQAIEGCSRSPYHMGENENGMRYDSLDLILRSADHIDRFIAIYHNPPKLKGKQARVEAINRQAMEEFLSGSHDPFASSGDTIDGEVIRDA